MPILTGSSSPKVNEGQRTRSRPRSNAGNRVSETTPLIGAPDDAPVLSSSSFRGSSLYCDNENSQTGPLPQSGPYNEIFAIMDRMRQNITQQVESLTAWRSLHSRPITHARFARRTTFIKAFLKPKGFFFVVLAYPLFVIYLVVIGCCIFAVSPIITFIIKITLRPIRRLAYLILHGPLHGSLVEKCLRSQQDWNMPHYCRPLGQDETEIRLLRILPRDGSCEIRCNLVYGSWDHSQYEALSYAWGSSQKLVKISLDSKPFLVTEGLHQALSHLQYEEDVRTVWIDAICICQYDIEEREGQVKVMAEIYKNAKRVVIWLGKAPEGLGFAFEQVRQLHHSSHSPSENSNAWQHSIRELLGRSWWKRMWVVQEVACAQDVIVQSDKCTIAWDDLSWLVTNPDTSCLLGIKYSQRRFMTEINDLRYMRTDSESAWLKLAYHFRYRQATDGRDKIYAVRGLLKDPLHQRAFVVMYRWERDFVYISFARFCLEEYKSLAVITLAEQNPLLGSVIKPSWCPDWRWPPGWRFTTSFQELFLGPTEFDRPIPFWNGGLGDQLYLNGKYSAAGNISARCRTHYPRSPRVISLEGFSYDVVRAVSHKVYGLNNGLNNTSQVFPKWERFLGGPWHGDDMDTGKIFSLTVTAGVWLQAPQDWRYWYGDETKSIIDDESHVLQDMEKYRNITHSVCVDRRLFVTKNGSFGIGPSQIQSGDVVCVLFGSDVPFVLRQTDHSLHLSPFCENRDHFPILHKFIGQSYIHGIMHYQGDIKQDIEIGKLVVEEFFLE